MEKIKQFIYKNSKEVLLFVIYLALISLYKVMTQSFSANPHDLKIIIDDYIPFIKEFIVIYHLYFFLGLGVYTYLLIKEKKLYLKVISYQIMGTLLGYITFIIYPNSVNVRPIIESSDIFSWMVNYTYSIDQTNGGFPSLHAISLLIIIYASFKSTTMKKWVKSIIILIATLNIASTVLVKQHVILDLVGSIIYVIFIVFLRKFTLKVSKKMKKD